MRKSFLVIALASVATVAVAQDRPESILPPGFDQPTPAPVPTPAPAPASAPSQSPDAVEEGASNDGLGDQEGEVAASDDAEASGDEASVDDRGTGEASQLSVAADFGAQPWGSTRGAYLRTLMRRLDTPLALRWGHIALRNALMAPGTAPASMSNADWVAERAWLLLRMGEADGARLLVSTVPKSDYTPKMTQVALQTALATSDPAAMCPAPRNLSKVEGTAGPLVDAMCAALSGQPEVAADAISRARRRGLAGGIDISLTDKLVGAGSSTARAVTLDWEPVTELTSWRYGLATATGVELPPRLYDEASPQLRAWNARAPLLTPAQRLAAARTATGLGVFSGQALVDLYSLFYDTSDADAIAGSQALDLRQAFVAASIDERLSAMSRLWSLGQDDLIERRASYSALGRAASRIIPNEGLVDDAPRLAASMFAMGLDDSAMRWVSVLDDLSEDDADPLWAQLALGAPEAGSVDLSRDRVDDFGGRDKSAGKWRAKLLVAGLAGLGRLSAGDLDAFDSKLDMGMSRESKLTRDIDDAARRGDAATVVLLAAVAMQTREPSDLSPRYLFHLVRALRMTGQDYFARMIAAEALAPA